MLVGRRLTKQLVKIFGTSHLAEIEQVVCSQDEALRKTFVSQWAEFVSLVDRSYEQDFKKLEISTHSLSVSSEELRVQNSKLNTAKRQIDHMLDSMDEGLFLINSEGLVTPVVSKPAFEIIGESPVGKYVWDLVGATVEEVASLREWYLFLFEVEDPSAVLDLAPGSMVRTNSLIKEIRLSFKPVFSQERKLEGILMIAVDITELVQSQREYQRLTILAEMILKKFQNPMEFSKALKHFDSTVEELKASSENADQEGLLRSLHTCKSVMSLFSLISLAEAMHIAETMVLNKSSVPSIVLRLNEARARFFEEHQQVLKLSDVSESQVLLETSSVEQFGKSLNEFEKALKKDFSAQALRQFEFIKETFYRDFLCVSMASLLEPLRYFVQQRSADSEKSIDFRVNLKSLKDKSNDVRCSSARMSPLINVFNHVISNAIVHGIETSAERVASGKPSTASLEVSVVDQESNLVFSIKDDGRGIDFSALREKALAIGLPVNELSDDELIFSSGVSSRGQADFFSGRGVGMGAVREVVRSLHGQIEIKSEIGFGTEVKVIIPSLEKIERDQAA